jgi:hypothetical protein
LLIPEAAAIALGFGLATLAVASGGRVRSWQFAAFAAGGVAFPITVFLASSIQMLATLGLGWGPDAIAMTLGGGLVGAVITAAVNEVFILAAALLVWTWSCRQGSVVGFGAAAGAGYGAVGAYQVLQFTLMARALPISSASGFAGSLVQQFAFVALHGAAAALAALGMTRRRPAAYIAAAVLVETIFLAFGLLYELRAYSNVVWSALDVAVAAAAGAGAVVAGRRHTSDAALPSAA